jgi:hypothetical protein
MERLERGDIQTDPDGSRWVITGVGTLNGRVKYSRVREGSLAAEIIFGKKEEDDGKS